MVKPYLTHHLSVAKNTPPSKKALGLILLILATFALSFFIKCEKGVYPIVTNLSLLPLGALTYLEGLIFGLLGGIFCIVCFLFFGFYANVKFISVLPTLFAFVATPFALGLLRNVFEGMESEMARGIDRSGKEVEGIKKEEEDLGEGLKALDKQVSAIASLYEITKEMSSTLLFGDIFKIFSEFLKANFKFAACKLILIAQGQENETIEKVYKLETGLPNVIDPELVDIDILSEVSKVKKVIFWEDFIAIPLVSQDRIIGVLNVEGLNEAALEKFLITSRQFSLAIEKVRLYETVQALAITDGLTGVFVRRYFLEMLKEEFERSFRHHFKLSFIMIDLDMFKQYNDKFGHLVGDVILKEVAKTLKQNVREIDLLGRYGGEEFSLLLPETDKDGAILVAERLRNAVASQNFKAYDEAINITISGGVATFPDDVSSNADLIEFADHALYEAKAQGRNRIIYKSR